MGYEAQRAALVPGQGTVQRKAKGGPGADAPAADVQQAATKGVAGAGQALPHLAVIQKAFGRHDVSGVSAFIGGAAAAAAGAIGAEAYAVGDRVAFASHPSLHTAAHEAAHVLQQRAGVAPSGGVGREGDAHERQADQVA